MCLLISCAGCQKDFVIEDNTTDGPKFPLSIHIQNVVDNDDLILNSVTYSNPFGQPYTVSLLRYYISHIKLINTITGDTSSANELYFLVDASKEGSGNLTALYKEGKYNKIQFLIGVDSITNAAGAQTGVLSAENGMFWAWATGYVFAKIEGDSPEAASGHFSYHIGGFAAPFSALKQVELTLADGKEVEVTENSQPLRVQANVNTWFKNIHDLQIGQNPDMIHSVGMLAMQYADNYAGMFTLQPLGAP